MKPRVFRKFASIALVAAMAISSVSPVYATDVEDQPEITVESEAETDNPCRRDGRIGTCGIRRDFGIY